MRMNKFKEGKVASCSECGSNDVVEGDPCLELALSVLDEFDRKFQRTERENHQ
jgi:hypothetical protein